MPLNRSHTYQNERLQARIQIRIDFFAWFDVSTIEVISLAAYTTIIVRIQEVWGRCLKVVIFYSYRVRKFCVNCPELVSTVRIIVFGVCKNDKIKLTFVSEPVQMVGRLEDSFRGNYREGRKDIYQWQSKCFKRTGRLPRTKSDCVMYGVSFLNVCITGNYCWLLSRKLNKYIFKAICILCKMLDNESSRFTLIM